MSGLEKAADALKISIIWRSWENLDVKRLSVYLDINIKKWGLKPAAQDCMYLCWTPRPTHCYTGDTEDLIMLVCLEIDHKSDFESLRVTLCKVEAKILNRTNPNPT